jgi:bifunctional DNA-binding transcriptional regulator/antitoxin component of YhaV-PrlF toxin-antitoxin module
MVMRVQLVEGEYRVVLPLHALEAMNLKEGDPVDRQRVETDSLAEHRTLSLEEGMAAYCSFELDNRQVFLELAK